MNITTPNTRVISALELAWGSAHRYSQSSTAVNKHAVAEYWEVLNSLLLKAVPSHGGPTCLH
jgi:hypothetical protein